METEPSSATPSQPICRREKRFRFPIFRQALKDFSAVLCALCALSRQNQRRLAVINRLPPSRPRFPGAESPSGAVDAIALAANPLPPGGTSLPSVPDRPCASGMPSRPGRTGLPSKKRGFPRRRTGLPPKKRRFLRRRIGILSKKCQFARVESAFCRKNGLPPPVESPFCRENADSTASDRHFAAGMPIRRRRIGILPAKPGFDAVETPFSWQNGHSTEGKMRFVWRNLLSDRALRQNHGFLVPPPRWDAAIRAGLSCTPPGVCPYGATSLSPAVGAERLPWVHDPERCSTPTGLHQTVRRKLKPLQG